VSQCPNAAGFNYWDPNLNSMQSWGLPAATNQIVWDFTSQTNYNSTTTKISEYMSNNSNAAPN